MNNSFCIIVIGMLFAMTACLFAYALRRRGESLHSKAHALFFASIMLWSVTEIVYYSVRTESALRYAYYIKLAAAAAAFVMFLLVVASFYRSERGLPAWVRAALLCPPAATVILSVLNGALITKHFDAVSFTPLVEVRVAYGVWYYIIVAFMAATVPAAAAIIGLCYRDRPRAYRNESVLLTLSLVSFALGSAFKAFSPVMSYIGYILVASGCIFLYIAIDLSGRAGYLQIERAEVFDYLDAAVFLLGPEGRIIDMNVSARALMDVLGEDGEGQRLDNYLMSLFAKGKIIRLSENEQTTDIYVANANFPLIYRMTRHEISAEGQSAAWAFAAFEDVTRNQLLVERLQSMAGVDSLTGLYNRYGYMELLRTLDLPENLPITVIMGDVNGLKQINDTHGHAAGDRFLIAIAAAIKSCCGENCYAARIGGDEFVVLAKKCDEAQSQRLMEQLHAAVAAAEGLEQSASIALGCATKNTADENINALLNRADRQMYIEKSS